MISYILFGDESTLPSMNELLSEHVIFSVVASKRKHRQPVGVPNILVQPPKNTSGYRKFLGKIADARPDVLLCNSYSMILDGEVLEMPRICSINLHGGMLPQMRGANALNWSIIEGRTKTAMTTHFLTEEIDAGDVISQKEISIKFSDTAVDVKRKLDNASLELITAIHDDLVAGKHLTGKSQDHGQAKYYRRRKPSDGLINWNKPTIEIYNLIRALVSPWPGAFYFNHLGEKVTLDTYHSFREVEALKSRLNG